LLDESMRRSSDITSDYARPDNLAIASAASIWSDPWS
jgi:hypothetical protein